MGKRTKEECLITKGGRAVKLPEGGWRPRRDRGRPPDNQAGLPPTEGLEGKSRWLILGLQTNDRFALPRFNFPGSTRARLTPDQRTTEWVGADETQEQRQAQADWEEESSRPARRETERMELSDSWDQRRAGARGQRQLMEDLEVGDDGV